MDAITKKFLLDFKKLYEIETMKEDDAFEYFVNYCCVNKENGLVDIKLKEFSTGKNAQGIDGIAIIVNHKLVTSISEIEFQIENSSFLDVKFVFIQTKTSESFDNTLMLNFFEFTKAFFEDDETVFDIPEIKNFFEMKQFIYDNAEYMTERNPQLSMYYVSTGKWVEDKTLVKLINRNKKELETFRIFSCIEFYPCGATEIQDLYRKSKNVLKAKFKFEKNIEMFSGEDGEPTGYSGIIPFKEFRKIIIGDGDSLRPVFDDNIRDFLGNKNPVNSEIQKSLDVMDINSFCMLNNGITIVANRATVTGTTAILNDYQIVNGCQTSHVLYENRNLKGIDELLIPIKLIGTTNDDMKNMITKATNSQTSIKPEQLEALSDFQKKLEVYYSTFENSNARLYYERRTGQYRVSSVPKTRIVNIPSQIKSVTAMFLDDPHGVSGNYGAIVKKVGHRIFKSNDKKIIYYTSSLAQYKIEYMIDNKIIDKKYNKARYHAMMLFRMVIAGKKVPRFNENKMDAYCQKIIDVLNDENQCKDLFKKIVNFIADQDAIDFDDRKTFERKETTEYLKSKLKSLNTYLNSK
ncbi:AIPR family protein [Anaeromicropila herbilytica]|uniref:Abortive phage infection protein C-terminal domain-containing protein n=1 Tax=Anaeromicropila herbilytica TaxID=2785025 RepID=A0A7R7ENV4_9FIRM|nr:AIPR family protein [Anaeromicropila herbilytica]BCN31922.1 hypothetical protein bsdtb5_32170 [Anaeromicropila herbilytica]